MCSPSPANRRRNDRWRSRTRATALVLACLCCPCLAAERPPSWLTELASTRIPEYDSEVGAVVLLNEHTVTVEPDGKVTTSVRKAIKVLTREGRREARGGVIYRRDSGKVRRLRAWTLYPSGASKAHRKKDIIDVSLVEDDVYDVYDESRQSSIRGTADADTGSVFGYESVLEDRSVFTQFSFSFQDDLPPCSPASAWSCHRAGRLNRSRTTTRPLNPWSKTRPTPGNWNTSLRFPTNPPGPG